MTIDFVQPASLPAPAIPSGSRAPASSDAFADMLRGASDADREDRVRTAAEQFVSSAFLAPLLALVRDASISEGPFSPGAAERRFGPMLDQHLADRVVQSGNFPLVTKLEEHMRGLAGLPAPVTPTPSKERFDARA